MCAALGRYKETFSRGQWLPLIPAVKLSPTGINAVGATASTSVTTSLPTPVRQVVRDLAVYDFVMGIGLFSSLGTLLAVTHP